ncbi:MAG: mechanosensitive ion channel [Bacteroidales bacterium]
MAIAHPFAEKLVETIKSHLINWGVSPMRVDELDGTIYVLLIVSFSLLLAWGVRYVLHKLLLYLLRNNKSRVVRILVSHEVFSRIIFVIPPLIIISLLPLVYDDYPSFIKVMERMGWIYFVLSVVAYSNFFITAVWHIVSTSEANSTRPLHGMLQLLRGVIIGLGVIATVSILINKSPLNLITGLGAFAAVLMLVFKDSILGFVAGVQLAQNDIIRKGDWIVTSDGMANGIVTDIALNTVKIQNFDNTTVTIPPYSLISTPMQNWRGMQDSGGRRIMASLMVDADTIVMMTPELLESLQEIEILKSYITQKEAQRDAGNIENTDNAAGLVNGTIETNLGLFRAYVTIYLQKHPFVNANLLLMIRLLEPTINGIPFQIYCFSANKVWQSYESIQSEILEHVISVAHCFSLRIFQNLSGQDYIQAAEASVKPLPVVTKN